MWQTYVLFTVTWDTQCWLKFNSVYYVLFVPFERRSPVLTTPTNSFHLAGRPLYICMYEYIVQSDNDCNLGSKQRKSQKRIRTKPFSITRHHITILYPRNEAKSVISSMPLNISSRPVVVFLQRPPKSAPFILLFFLAECVYFIST